MGNEEENVMKNDRENVVRDGRDNGTNNSRHFQVTGQREFVNASTVNVEQSFESSSRNTTRFYLVGSTSTFLFAKEHFLREMSTIFLGFYRFALKPCSR